MNRMWFENTVYVVSMTCMGVIKFADSPNIVYVPLVYSLFVFGGSFAIYHANWVSLSTFLVRNHSNWLGQVGIKLVGFGRDQRVRKIDIWRNRHGLRELSDESSKRMLLHLTLLKITAISLILSALFWFMVSEKLAE